MEGVEFEILDPNDNDKIELIASWYFEEWKIPIKQTTKSLSLIPNYNAFFQIVAIKDGIPIGTGGLHQHVGLKDHVKKYAETAPWIALLYIKSEERGNGIGSTLLQEIEATAKSKKFNQIFLFTYTAEPLYRKFGWNLIEKINIKEKEISVLEKGLG